MQFNVVKCTDWQRYDIKGVESINWSGSSGSGARQLKLVVANNGFVFNCGDVISCIDDFNYVGQITDRDLSNKQPTIEINTMDYMLHLENSKDTMVVNSTPEGVAMMICNKLGLAIGSIVPTGMATGEQIFKNKTYYDIISELYKKVNKKLYQVYMDGPCFCVRIKGEIVDYVLDDSVNCEKVDAHESIKNLINRVVVYDKKNKYIGERNAPSVAKYGAFQDVAKEDDNIDDILKEEERSLKIKGLGNLKCISGKYIRFRDSETGIKAIYEITEDRHTIKDNYHSMELTLEFISL